MKKGAVKALFSHKFCVFLRRKNGGIDIDNMRGIWYNQPIINSAVSAREKAFSAGTALRRLFGRPPTDAQIYRG